MTVKTIFVCFASKKKAKFDRTTEIHNGTRGFKGRPFSDDDDDDDVDVDENDDEDSSGDEAQAVGHMIVNFRGDERYKWRKPGKGRSDFRKRSDGRRRKLSTGSVEGRPPREPEIVAERQI